MTSRRQFNIGLGTVLAAIVLDPVEALSQAATALPVSLAGNPRLTSWISIEDDGNFTVFTGKAELGQGILTALAQISAEELDVPLARVRVVGPNTAHGPNELYTYGSQSIEQSGAAIRLASAQARSLLVDAAAIIFACPRAQVYTEDGTVVAHDGRRMRYEALAHEAGRIFDRRVETAGLALKDPRHYRIVGTSAPRSDIPEKFFGGPAFIQDFRLPGMLHGRVVRPPRFGSRFLGADLEGAQSLPGVVTVVVDGSFVAVVAAREEQAIAARRHLIESSRWQDQTPPLPDQVRLSDALLSWQREDSVVRSVGQAKDIDEGSSRHEQTYSRPYLSQASIGPSCALAHFERGHLSVWSHTQGVFPLRKDLATAIALPEHAVDVFHVPGSGCYGQNGADDVALDAALLARALDGRPVRVQWMRDDEFKWAPASPPMRIHLEASLGKDGVVTDWCHELWSNSHAMRPGQPGGINLLAASSTSISFPRSPPLRIPQPTGDGDRNAPPIYDFARQKVVNHLLLETPIRNGSLRTLGGQGNIFAIESFMDELATAANIDPVEFRLMHLSDRRAKDAILAAAKEAGWQPGVGGDGIRGRGFAFSRYKNIGAYAAVVLDVEIERASGSVRVLSVVLAIDVGQVVNPDGVVAQIEGGALQAVSIALKEQLAFDRSAVTARDWLTYPILAFSEIPTIKVLLLNRPDEPSLGAGEGSLAPTVAALANAFAHATGRRIRDLPMTADRVLEALA